MLVAFSMTYLLGTLALVSVAYMGRHWMMIW
jgi:hypothetical protein